VFLEFINQFILKKVLGLARTVRFLVPITQRQIDVDRGGGLVKQIEVLLQVFKGSDYNEIKHAVQPIITKVDPNDEDFDIDITISNAYKILTNYLKNYGK
jgi:hypothetical protein